MELSLDKPQAPLADTGHEKLLGVLIWDSTEMANSVVSVSSNEEGFLFTSASGSRQVAPEVVHRSSVLRTLLSHGREERFDLPVPNDETDVWLEAVSRLTEPSATVGLRHLQCSQLAQYMQVHLLITTSERVIFRCA